MAHTSEQLFSIHWLAAQTVADREDLDVADVYRALAYNHENPDEMANSQTHRERHSEGARDDDAVATGPMDLGETVE